jgi:site-specific recombinase XerD/ribosomal protein L40E
MGIYNESNKLDYWISKVGSSDLAEDKKKMILSFCDECFAQGLTKTRVLFYVPKLWKLCQWVKKDFKKMTKDDVKTLIREIEMKDYTDWTKYGYKITIKKLFQWLSGKEWKSKEYPETVRWITTTVKNKRKDKILTLEDVTALLKATRKIRDRALISVLYDSGCRIGELLPLKIGDVNIDKKGRCKISITGKTGPRNILIVPSVPNLLNWLSEHHERDNTNAFVWINIGGGNERIGYQSVKKILRDAAKKAGIMKPVNPHQFRHSAATRDSKYLTEAQMCARYGWAQGSKMPRVYVHISGRDVDGAVLRMYGEEMEQESIASKKCPRCNNQNSTEDDYCRRCYMPLTQKAVSEMMETKTVEIPENMDKIIEKIIVKWMNKNQDKIKELYT